MFDPLWCMTSFMDGPKFTKHGLEEYKKRTGSRPTYFWEES